MTPDDIKIELNNKLQNGELFPPFHMLAEDYKLAYSIKKNNAIYEAIAHFFLFVVAFIILILNTNNYTILGFILVSFSIFFEYMLSRHSNVLHSLLFMIKLLNIPKINNGLLLVIKKAWETCSSSKKSSYILSDEWLSKYIAKNTIIVFLLSISKTILIFTGLLLSSIGLF